MKVQAAPPEHYTWVAIRTGCVVTSDFRAVEAIDDNGKIRGMVGYSAWAPNSVQAHMAVESSMVWRHLLKPALSYPFEEAKRGVLVGIINSRNKRSLRMAQHLGFREVGRIKDGYLPGADLVVLQLKKEECGQLARKQEAA